MFCVALGTFPEKAYKISRLGERHTCYRVLHGLGSCLRPGRKHILRVLATKVDVLSGSVERDGWALHVERRPLTSDGGERRVSAGSKGRPVSGGRVGPIDVPLLFSGGFWTLRTQPGAFRTSGTRSKRPPPPLPGVRVLGFGFGCFRAGLIREWSCCRRLL